MKKIAVAVKDNGKKTEHFGISEYFIVYNYDEKKHDIKYDNVIFSSKNRNSQEEWEKSANAIKDCDIVICEKIGLKAKAEVEMMNIRIIEEEGSLEDILDNFLKIEIKKDKIIL